MDEKYERMSEVDVITDPLHIGRSMSVVLDGFRFTIEAVDESKPRTLIRLRSTYLLGGIEQVIVAYRSQSHVRFWRLCLNKNGPLYKGKDYIQASMIDIRLQVFINQQLETRREFIPSTLLSCHYDDATSGQEWDEIHNHLRSRQRYNMIPEFDIERQCGDHHGDAREVGKISSQLSINYDIEFDTLSQLGKIPSSVFLIDSIPVEYEATLFMITLSPFDTDNDKLRLYFMKYDIKVDQVERYDMLAPVLMSFNTTLISAYGTYDSYVNVGNYICKIFEYRVQCVDGDICTENYSYIGDRYLNLWPMNQLKMYMFN